MICISRVTWKKRWNEKWSEFCGAQQVVADIAYQSTECWGWGQNVGGCSASWGWSVHWTLFCLYCISALREYVMHLHQLDITYNMIMPGIKSSSKYSSYLNLSWITILIYPVIQNNHFSKTYSTLNVIKGICMENGRWKRKWHRFIFAKKRFRNISEKDIFGSFFSYWQKYQGQIFGRKYVILHKLLRLCCIASHFYGVASSNSNFQKSLKNSLFFNFERLLPGKYHFD